MHKKTFWETFLLHDFIFKSTFGLPGNVFLASQGLRFWKADSSGILIQYY